MLIKLPKWTTSYVEARDVAASRIVLPPIDTISTCIGTSAQGACRTDDARPDSKRAKLSRQACIDETFRTRDDDLRPSCGALF